MAENILEIHRLARNGETLRRIRCLPARVTVLRAAREEELDLYFSAVKGEQTKERFALLFNESPFHPEHHTLINSLQPFRFPEKCVRDYLVSADCVPGDLEPLLLKTGLGGSQGRMCHELSEGEQETLAILSATFMPGKILVLHCPFTRMDEVWREEAARVVAEFAATRNGTVLVTRLPYRPQCWIENEYIARIQVERPRKATIGFGGEGLGDAARAVQAVRENSGAGMPPDGVQTFAGQIPLCSPARRSEILLNRIMPRMAIALATVSLLVSAVFVYTLSGGGIHDATVASTASPVSDSNAAREPSDIAAALHHESSVAEVKQEPRQQASHALLDNYPAEMQEGVRLAFMEPQKLLAAAGGVEMQNSSQIEMLMQAMRGDKPGDGAESRRKDY